MHKFCICMRNISLFLHSLFIHISTLYPICAGLAKKWQLQPMRKWQKVGQKSGKFLAKYVVDKMLATMEYCQTQKLKRPDFRYETKTRSHFGVASKLSLISKSKVNKMLTSLEKKVVPCTLRFWKGCKLVHITKTYLNWENGRRNKIRVKNKNWNTECWKKYWEKYARKKLKSLSLYRLYRSHCMLPECTIGSGVYCGWSAFAAVAVATTSVIFSRGPCGFDGGGGW